MPTRSPCRPCLCRALLLLLALAAAPACLGRASSSRSPGVLALNGRAAAGVSASEPARERPAARLTPQEIFDRWRGFLEERFGGEPEGALAADFDGDGQREAATVLGGDLFIFEGLTEPTPERWTRVLRGPQAAAPRVESAAWARAAMPRLAREIGGTAVLVVGEEAPLVVFYAQLRGEYAWAQVIPPRLGPLSRRAAAPTPGAFDLRENNLTGPEGREEPGLLRAGFVGDFDADGDRELAVVDARRRSVLLWEPGVSAPLVAPLDYPAVRGGLHQSDHLQVTPLRSAASEVGAETESPRPVDVRGDFLELWIPEESSLYLVRADGAWKTLWLSD